MPTFQNCAQGSGIVQLHGPHPDMPFALCFDPWAVKNNDGSMPDKATCNNKMIEALKHPDTQAILNLPCYLPGKPVLDFSIGADPGTIENAVPGIDYWL